jgi:hypothetical protein
LCADEKVKLIILIKVFAVHPKQTVKQHRYEELGKCPFGMNPIKMPLWKKQIVCQNKAQRSATVV